MIMFSYVISVALAFVSVFLLSRCAKLGYIIR